MVHPGARHITVAGVSKLFGPDDSALDVRPVGNPIFLVGNLVADAPLLPDILHLIDFHGARRAADIVVQRPVDRAAGRLGAVAGFCAGNKTQDFPQAVATFTGKSNAADRPVALAGERACRRHRKRSIRGRAINIRRVDIGSLRGGRGTHGGRGLAVIRRDIEEAVQ